MLLTGIRGSIDLVVFIYHLFRELLAGEVHFSQNSFQVENSCPCSDKPDITIISTIQGETEAF